MRRIVWTNVSGKENRGCPLPDDTAKDLALEMGRKYPDIRHWTETVDDEVPS